MTTPTLTVVAPCYNETEVLRETNRQVLAALESLSAQGLISPDYVICYVDDGSSDGTWELIEALRSEHGCVQGLRLSRNRGHQNALFAGLMEAPGDALISIDADLQDDPAVIEQMVRSFRAGHDVVYGVRADRSTDGSFKRWSAELYYRVLAMLGVSVVFNHADFRLLSRRAVETLREYREVNLFLRGLMPQLGFPSSTIPYTRQARFAGESKYPLGKMIALALEGVTSFSAAPLRAITVLGISVSAISVLLAVWAAWLAVFTEQAVPGWASIVVPMALLGGVNLFCVGIIGEYVAKIYLEVKARPRYTVQDRIGAATGPAGTVMPSAAASARDAVNAQ
ncbi:MAG: glycosyltransferase [Spiribacter salinus]|uniref:Glycosyltransferase n=1 Tax=Spiribacter salinus TaxID=1335746 RepID=A0A540VSA5_9GAMM|nr:MAG: glycosyltransferase [Spiribacter salinus]